MLPHVVLLNPPQCTFFEEFFESSVGVILLVFAATTTTWLRMAGCWSGATRHHNSPHNDMLYHHLIPMITTVPAATTTTWLKMDGCWVGALTTATLLTPKRCNTSAPAAITTTWLRMDGCWVGATRRRSTGASTTNPSLEASLNPQKMPGPCWNTWMMLWVSRRIKCGIQSCSSLTVHC